MTRFIRNLLLVLLAVAGVFAVAGPASAAPAQRSSVHRGAWTSCAHIYDGVIRGRTLESSHSAPQQWCHAVGNISGFGIPTITRSGYGSWGIDYLVHH